jgi:hypothetical protein
VVEPNDEIEPLIDPDAFDLIVQGLAAMSSIATLATAWVQIRSGRPRNPNNQGNILQLLKQLERSFDDLFDGNGIRTAIRIMEPAFERQNSSQLMNEKPQFGSRISLSALEFQGLYQVWNQISDHFRSVRNTTNTLQLTLRHTAYDAEDQITDNLDDFSTLMNQLLFESKTFGEALDRLYQLRRRANDYLSRLMRHRTIND